jgi:hypothetical protein
MKEQTVFTSDGIEWVLTLDGVLKPKHRTTKYRLIYPLPTILDGTKAEFEIIEDNGNATSN